MCYAVPIAGAITTSLLWRKTKSIKIWWLALMFYGGALFGFIDHLWNKELFLISGDIIRDLLLGLAISLAIVIVWGLVLVLAKFNPASALANYLNSAK